MKKTLIIVFGFLLFSAQLDAWPPRARGAALYEAAYGWVNTALQYIQGWPQSQSWDGRGPSGYEDEYWITFGQAGQAQAWINPETSNPGAFDCAGFVSWCGGLRQHLTTNLEWNQIIWLKGETVEDLRKAAKGDLLLKYGQTTGHIRIVRDYDPINDWINFVDANEGQNFAVSISRAFVQDLHDGGYKLYNFIGDEPPDVNKIVPINKKTTDPIEDGGKYGQPFELGFTLPTLPPLGYLFRIILIKEGIPGNYLLQHGWDLECGKYQLSVEVMNWASTCNLLFRNFEVVDVPQVIFTDPAQGAGGVDVYKEIKIVFNKPMDTVSVREALTVARLNPPRECLLLCTEWDTEMKTLEVLMRDPAVPDSGFDFYNDYNVIISGQIARDTAGVLLDGDENGQPGGNKVFSFKTRQPEFSFWVNPSIQRATLSYQWPPDYASALFWVVVKNQEYRRLPIEYYVIGGGYGWYVSHTQPYTFTVESQATDSAGFSIIRRIPEPGAIAVTAYGKSYEIEQTGVACFWVTEREQQYGEPSPPVGGLDENYSISHPNFPSPWILNPYAKVGIFLSGYAECLGHLLGKYKISTCVVLDNFKILGASDRPLSDLDVLIIPSGGLIPYHNLSFYQNKFKEYVEQGGVLVCFTQSHGDVFAALPGSPSGYGWTQDQSCHAYACYLNFWDTFMAGQNNIVYDGNMDGYLTQYPDNSDLFLMRIANGYPAFIRYPYGQGKVILTTGYTDFAYRFGGNFKDEAALVRDLITSYIVLDSIPEYYKNSAIPLTNVPIYYPTYEDSIPANRAKITICYPNRESLRTDEIDLMTPMVPGDTQIVSLPSLIAPCSLGIYPLMFRLYQDTIPATEVEYSNAFAVKCSIPVGNYNLGDFQIWATFPVESILTNSIIEFEIFVRNNTQDTLFGKIYLGRQIGVNIWEDSLVNLIILPDTVHRFQWQTVHYFSRRYSFVLFDPSINKSLAWFNKWISSYPANAQVVVRSDTNYYFIGGIVRYENSFTTNFSETDTFETKVIRVVDNALLYVNKDTITYMIEGVMRDDSFSIQGWLPGAYKIETSAYRKGKLLKKGYAYFTIEPPRVSFEVIPDMKITGDDTTRFIFSVMPETTVCVNNELEYWIGRRHPPYYYPVLTGTIEIDTLQNEDTIIFPFNLPMDSLVFDRYTFCYTLKSIDTVSGSYDFWNAISFTTQLDRQSYSWRDTITMSVRVKNLGVFEESLHFEIKTPCPGYVWQDGTADFFMHLNMDTLLIFKSYIMEGYGAGLYRLYPRIYTKATLIQNELRFLLNVPKILIATDTITYQIGDTITVIFYNAGGVEGELRLREIGLYDYYGNCYYKDSAYVVLQPDSFFFYKIPLDTLLEGNYNVFVNARIENYNKDFTYFCGLHIDGVGADIALKTSKEIYLPYQEVKPQADCKNGDYQFNGKLDLSIRPYGLYPGDTTFIPGDEWLWRIDEWTSPGCTLQDGRLKLLGWDRMYHIDWWSLEPQKGRGGKGGQRELLLRLLEAKRQGKGRGEEPIRYTAMAQRDGKLYASITTDIRRKILGPYPEWNETYDLSQIASIYQFTMDDHYFYIVDTDSEYIYKISRGSGAIETRWKVSQPGGIGIFNNNLYVVDRINHSILKTDLNGDTISVFGQDSLLEPMDLAIDNSGRIYVSDINKSRVYIFDTQGNFLGTKGQGRFLKIAVDNKGYLYGADMDSLKTAKYDEDGNLLEYYWYYPDEIMNCDTLVHLAKIYSDYFDYVSAEVLVNYGRNKGYTNTQAINIPGLKFINSFVPTDDPKSGVIDYYFSYGYPNGHEWPIVPIESLPYIDFEELYSPYVYFRADMTKPDFGESPEIERFDISYLTRRSGDIVWQDSVQLSFPPQESVLVEKNAGVFSDSGEFILWGDAYLNNGQHLPPLNTHNFYVLPSLLGLSLKTDREIYYPGEEIKTSAIVVNNSDSTYTDIHLELFKREVEVFDTLISSIPGQSSCTLLVYLYDSSSFALKGLLTRSGLDTLKQYKSVDIEIPDVGFGVAYPCSASHRPFDVQTEVSNFWSRDVEVVLRSACGDSVYLDTFLLLPNESRIIERTFLITEDETLYTEIIRPTKITERYEIRFGEKLGVEIDSVVSSVNSVLIPYSVVNTGEFDCAFNLHLEILDSSGAIQDSITYHYLLPIGDTLNGEWGVSLTYARYSLNWMAKPESASVILSQGSVSVNIIEPNLVSIDSIVLLAECDSVGNLLVDVPVRNNSANLFYGNIGLYSSFIDEIKELEIGPLMDTTIRFLTNAILSPGFYQLSAQILQNGAVIDEYIDSILFSPQLLIDSLPEYTFNIGDTARIIIKTKNTGTAVGEENLRLELGELGMETRFISLIPGETKVDTFILYIPEDMDERTIYGSVWLGDEEYILPIHILGYRVLVSASLNQPNFQEGDTVVLNLDIFNQNERNIKGFSTANYNGENIISEFYLAGYAQNIDFTNTETLKKTTENTEDGVYVSKVLWFDGWDSLMVKPEGYGNYGFWVRMVADDSVHYSAWTNDTIIRSGLIYQTIQFKVEFSDTVSYLERIDLRIYADGGFRDTIIETFEPLEISQEFTFPFEPSANLLFYGVYTETGRGLWLNTIYVFPANDTCNIITDRQVYDMGDTVFATVQSPYTGKLLWHADFYPMGTISDSLWVDSVNKNFEFILPDELTSGSYSIDFHFYINGDTLQRFSSSQVFDVRGYQLVVTECRLDTNEYLPGDSIFVRFKLNSNSAIPVITRLRFVQNYQYYDGLCDTVALDSGFNVVDFATLVPALNRGPALLNYSFFKDSLFLTYSNEGFMVYIPDTIPPSGQFVQIPENTYNPNIEHIVKIIASDETRISDTLYYHNGISLNRMCHNLKKGDTLIYKIPSQPRGTIISYNVVLWDSFMNKTRLPETDYNLFWVLSPLPPSNCQTDTLNQNIKITWQNPCEDLVYHFGYPYKAETDSIAVRFNPQYLPAELRTIKIFIEKTVQDTAILNIGFYSVNQGVPGNEIYPGEEIKIGAEGADWLEFQIDSVPLTDEVFIIFSGEGIRFYGDGRNDAYRTVIKDTIWTIDTTFGNLLVQARFLYKPEGIFYRVLREESGQFMVIGDSLRTKSFTDSLVGGERRYRYLVQNHWVIPDLNGTSPVLTQVYDYTPPVFGDSVAIIETDTLYIVGCEIFDGIGVAEDSLIYNGTAVGHDSVVDNWYWYGIPKGIRILGHQGISGKILKQVQKEKLGDVIAYYFIARDSSGNLARNPDTGYFYIIPVIPEGFSGHITRDTTWLSDILIKGDVWVDSGVTLTIGAGVRIKFIPDFDDERSGLDSTRAEFIIQGNLALLGNDSMPVVFTSNATQPEIGDWYGLRFENPKPSINIKNVEIGYAETGIFYGLNKVFKVKDCRIRYCNLGVNSQSKITLLMETEFLNNNQGAEINDGILNLVKGCEFRENRTGLLLKGEERKIKRLGDLATERLDDWETGREEVTRLRGYEDKMLKQPVDQIQEMVQNDRIEQGGEKGQMALVFDNLIADNDTGAVFSDYAIGMVRKNEITNNLIGVYITENALPILGIKMSGQNRIEIRSQKLDVRSQEQSYAVYNNTPNYILAEGNWWGTNDKDSIALFIWDYYDDTTKGIVDFIPYRQYSLAKSGEGGIQSNSTGNIKGLSLWLSSLVKGKGILMLCAAGEKIGALVEIYDIAGRLVKKKSMVFEPGYKEYKIGCENLAEGVYFIQIKTRNECITKKFVVVR